MAEAKTKVTSGSVSAFLRSISDESVRKDCSTVASIMQKATRSKPRMWGGSIVGFGTRTVTYASGKQADWMLVAFSPRKQNIVLYLSSSFDGRDALLSALGKHTTGKSCVYIKRLADVDQGVLRKLVKASVAHTRKHGSV